jgi:phage head maturation protease
MSRIESTSRKVDKVYGRVKGYASTTTTDTLGMRFTKNALEKMLEYYKQNPFIYYNHDKSRPPIGRIISQRIVKVENFYALEQEHEIYDAEIWKKLENGELKGISVGGVVKNE